VTEAERVVCPGYGSRPKRVTKWLRISGARPGTTAGSVAMRGLCPKCEKDCALTSGGCIWHHYAPKG
jgi:hypothetical protein